MIEMNVITTLPHYLAAVPTLLPVDYKAIVLASSTLSVIWHIQGEPTNLWFYLDYGGAGVWFLADVYYGNKVNKNEIVFLNLMIFFLNIYLKEYHAFWHILSCMKCIYVSRQLQQGLIAASTQRFRQASAV